MNSRQLLRGSLLAAATFAGGCSPDHRPAPATALEVAALTSGCTAGQPCTLTIPVPQGLTPQAVVLTGTSQLKIDDGSTVLAGSGFGTVANLGGGSTSTGVAARVGNLLSNGPISLASNTQVNGSITAGSTITQQTGVVITGTITHKQTATDSSRQVTVTFPTSAPPINLQPGQSQSPLPGSFGSVIVNRTATLSLSSGTYLFASFDTEPGANLRLDETAGPIFIYVQGALLHKGTEIQTGGDGNLFVGVFGSQAVSLQSPFRGTLVAPNAEVDLTSQSAGFAGRFIGANVELFPHTTVTALSAVIPPQPGDGVSPTLKCVTQLDATTMGAVFGYTNTTGANVTLGAGPHNLFSPGDADRGQPILFVPGTVPIATFQTFASGTTLRYTIGQQSVTASANAATCPAALSSALAQLFTDDVDSRQLRQQAVAIVANPNFSAWLNAVKSNGAGKLTPFESAILDAGLLSAANADLLGDPAGLTAAQKARIPAFRAALFANAAVTQLRLNGDALRGAPAAAPCQIVATIDGQQPRRTFGPLAPQPGSVNAQVQATGQLAAIENMQRTVAAVANGAQSAALLAAPGLYLEAYQPITSFPGIQLSGAVPTGLLSAIAGAVVGAVIGAAIGAKVGGPYGALIGGAIGAVVGGFTCGADPDFCEKIIGDDSCNACSGGASDTVTCGDDSCVDGCCSGVGGFMMMRSFLTGAGCPGGSATCQRDFDCGAGLFCVQQCCVDPQTIAGLCPNDGCSSDNDCVSGNHCRFGCCVGPCGVNGTACTEDPAPAMCGAPSAACGGGAACFEGCCVVQ